MYTWSCSFFSPIVVLSESRVLIENLRLHRAFRDRYTKPINLGLAEVVFFGMTTVGNCQYVSYLSHQCLSPHDKSVRQNFDTFRIRLTIDDVGIRDIEFLRHDKSFLSDYSSTLNSSLWYKIIRPNDHRTISWIEGFSDVCYSPLPHDALALMLLRTFFFETSVLAGNHFWILYSKTSSSGTFLKRQRLIQSIAIKRLVQLGTEDPRA